MKKILIVRTSAIGDVVFASPIIGALRRTYPEAYIAWLVEPGIDALIRHSPDIDECILWPQAELKALWRSGRRLEFIRRLRSFRKMLRDKGFDTVLDLQGLLKSGMLARMTSAPRRIGLGSREGSQWLMTEIMPRDGNTERISSEYLHIARQLGLDCGDFMPKVHPSMHAEERALALLADHALSPGKYAVFAAFTTRPQKHWFEDAWAHLASLIQEHTGMTPVLLGGTADKKAASRIASAAPGMVNLTGMTGLGEAAALVRHAGAVIGVDTGLTHMGIAFSVPTVALFGSTCPYTVTGRANARVIWLGMPCSPCKRRPTCGGKWTCLRDISPERVLKELEMTMEHPA